MDFTVLAKGIALAGCAIGAGLALIAGIGQHHKLKIRYYTFILSC